MSTQQGHMSFKDWCLIIGVSALTLAVVILVMVGAQAMLVDTGRQILGK